MGLVVVHGSEAGLQGLRNGSPEVVVAEMGNRIAERERLAMQSNQLEQELRRNAQELRTRVDEVTRVVIRNQGGNQAGEEDSETETSQSTKQYSTSRY